MSIFNPTANGDGDVINYQTIPRLCCARGRAPPITGWTLQSVWAYVADEHDTPVDLTLFGTAISRSATPDGNRNWKFCPASPHLNELPVLPAPADEDAPKTLHVKYTYYKNGLPPEPPTTSFEQVNWNVHQAAACGGCP